jgi:hypothetical protein
MPFKWKKTWPTICALKVTPFAAELEETTSCSAAVGARGYSYLRISWGNSFKLPRT